MPLFAVTVRKAINTVQTAFKWSNRYFVEVGDVAQALSVGQNEIWGGERNFHTTNTFCYEVYASDLLPNTDNYLIAPPPLAFQRGVYVPPAGELLPPWNVVRVDYPTATPGRPSRKFYRVPLSESDVAFDTLSTALFNAFATGVTFIAGIASIRDVDGQLLSTPQIRGITSRRLGREAFFAVPQPPPS